VIYCTYPGTVHSQRQGEETDEPDPPTPSVYIIHGGQFHTAGDMRTICGVLCVACNPMTRYILRDQMDGTCFTCARLAATQRAKRLHGAEGSVMQEHTHTHQTNPFFEPLVVGSSSARRKGWASIFHLHAIAIFFGAVDAKKKNTTAITYRDHSVAI
jgi:hypothetical protein